MAFHSPYATTIWDYINRAMPLTKEGTLKPNEVYALTAFILYKNGIIKEDEVMDEHSLPKVQMPNRDHFGLAPDWKHGAPRLEGYPWSLVKYECRDTIRYHTGMSGACNFVLLGPGPIANQQTDDLGGIATRFFAHNRALINSQLHFSVRQKSGTMVQARLPRYVAFLIRPGTVPTKFRNASAYQWR
jgi:hypothetical protein